jgi:cytochrome c oxidase assembly factor CtaG
MNWWCSATGRNWTWEWSPYLGAWILFLLLGVSLLLAWRKDRDFPLRRKFSAVLGLIILLIATDWPLATLGAGYLVSVQMARQVLVVFIAIPLLLYGAPPVVGRWLAAGQRRRRAFATISRPLVAVIVANAILIATMSPYFADRLISSQWGSFALDIAWIVAGFIIWFPLQPPTPLTPRLVGPFALVYLIIQSIVPLPVAFFMTWAEYPLFSVFELAPRVFASFDAVQDQQLGAAIFQVVGGLIIWSQIAFRFLHWAVEREKNDLEELEPREEPVPV